MKQWLVVGLETAIPWPTENTTTSYKGREITLRPETDTLAPTIVVPFEAPEASDHTLGLAMEFLSALAWVENRRIQPTTLITSTAILNIGKGEVDHIRNPSFRVDYLPEPSDDKARLALALYREALSVNSKPYQFLGFYKIINMLHAGGRDQTTWINATLGALDEREAKKRLAVLHGSESDVGEYLYVSGRCAVAHAFADPVVNPDDPQDVYRLAADLPLMKALAEYAIEHHFGVKSRRTVWREHLYELDGFRTQLGEQTVLRLKQKDNVPAGDLRPLPRLSIRLRQHGHFSAFEGLHGQIVEVRDGRTFVRCISSDGLVNTGLSLNFAEERLEFDPVAETQVRDDDSSKPMCYAADIHRFTIELLRNGELEVWDADSGALLGRCRPFIPEFDPRPAIARMELAIEQFEAEATRRAVSGSTGVNTDASEGDK